MIELRYFAWLRERVGTGHETIETQATTVAELIDVQSRRRAAATASCA